MGFKRRSGSDKGVASRQNHGQRGCSRQSGRQGGFGTFGQKRRRRPKSRRQVELARQMPKFLKVSFGVTIVFRGLTKVPKGASRARSSGACRRRLWDAAAVAIG